MNLAAIIRSFITAILAGIGAAVVSAIVLAVINLYLTGHNITWQTKGYHYMFFSGSILDIALLVISFTAMIAAAFISYRGRR